VVSVVSATGFEQEVVRLPVSTLSNLPALFKKLPDGHYRMNLTEPGSSKQRMVIEVELRDGRPLDPADQFEGTRDRPPTSAVESPPGSPIVMLGLPPAERPASGARAWLPAAGIEVVQGGVVQAGAYDHDQAVGVAIGGISLVAGHWGGREWRRGREAQADETMRRLKPKALSRAARLLHGVRRGRLV
jgi:hypothetical protein